MNAEPLERNEKLWGSWMETRIIMGGICVGCEDNDDKKKTIESLRPRLDGKQVCEQLKQMRRKLAAANNLSVDIVDCPSTGPCAGTCAQCDFEITQLQNLLLQIPEDKSVFPKVRIEQEPFVTYATKEEGHIFMGLIVE